MSPVHIESTMRGLAKSCIMSDENPTSEIRLNTKKAFP